MAGAPWYLLAGGIVLIIIGYFLASMGRPGSGQVFIDARMSDEEIERLMNKEDRGSPVANAVILLGFCLVLVSIGWRLVRFFV
jgi:hypothetical protein